MDKDCSVAPMLANNKDVAGDLKGPAHDVLFGLKGEKINGQEFSAGMPAWKGNLSDTDIAAVLTYIRTSLGNNGTPVTPADLAKIKK